MTEWEQFKYDRRLEILMRYLRDYSNQYGWDINGNDTGCEMKRFPRTMQIVFTESYGIDLLMNKVTYQYETDAEFIDDLPKE